ncbi:MAG: choice-of-anchor I family protein [Geminicoccaceae bacterium]
MRTLARIGLTAASLLAIAAGQAFAGAPGITLRPLGSYREEVRPGVCRTNIAQIGAYDAASRRVFVTNSTDRSLDILDIGNPWRPTLVRRVAVADLTGSDNFEPTGVAASGGLVALTAEAIDPVSAGGKVLLLDRNGRLLRAFAVGSGPERVAFTPNGLTIVASIQGEKDTDHAIDPKGGVAVIDLKRGIRRAEVRFADFSAFDSAALVAQGVRIGPNPSAPDQLQPAVLDLEPHFVTVSDDSRTAWVSLQVNNALAVVDLDRARVSAVLPLGLKNHNLPGNGLDASKDDGIVNIRHWPVWGAYMPDGIAAFRLHGTTWLATANEGDTRDDAIEVGDDAVQLDPAVFPDAAALQDRTRLGRLEVSTLPQDALPNARGEYRRLVAFGARSLALWSTAGRRLYDSGDQLEQITADPAQAGAGAAFFNTTDDANSFDNRSPRRGPQPLGLTVGRIGGRVYAFAGLEKQGGIIIANLTEAPARVSLGYASTRDFAQDPSAGGTLDTHEEVNCALDRSLPRPGRSDLAPEGLQFVPAERSPNHGPMLIVTYDTSGSTRMLAIERAR